jgi:Putative zincin peptidase
MKILGFSGQKEGKKSSTIKSLLIGAAVGLGSMVVGMKIGGSLVKEGSNGVSGQFLWAFLMFIPILVIHEAIHAIAYKYYGAEKVGFGYSMKSMMVYAYAQDFLVSMRQLKWIAAMPFLVITASLCLLLLVLPQYKTLIIMLLAIHTFCCMGDYALIKYANKNPHNFTYDDLENEKAMYFFKPISSSHS